MGNGGGIGDQSEAGGERCELQIRRDAGDAKAKIQGAGSGIENQGGKEEVRLIQEIAALTTFRNAMNSRNAMASRPAR